MNESDLKKLWQSSNEKIEQSLVITKRMTEDVTKIKVKNLVSTTTPTKVFALLVGVVWVSIGVPYVVNVFLNDFSESNKFFLFSATFQLWITMLALGVYTYQLVAISQIDLTAPLIDTQKRLVELQTSTLWVARILFLQLPAWTTFYWNERMVEDGNWFLWILQILVTFSFTVLAIWLFANIKYDNREKKWFQWIFSGREWTPLMKAMELLGEIRNAREKDHSTKD